MGVDYNAKVAYGIPIKLKKEWADSDFSYDWAEFYIKNLDSIEVPDEFADKKDYEKLEKAVLKEVGEVGIAVYGSGYTQSSYLLFYGKLTETEFGHEAFDAKVPADADAKLKRWCEVMGVKYKKPSWYVLGHIW